MDCLAEGRRLKKMSDNREMCPNGHFYDKSKYTQCPHCAKGMPPIKLSAFTTQAGSQMEEEAKKKTEKKGLFAGWKRGKEKDTEIPVSAEPPVKHSGNTESLRMPEAEGHGLTQGLQAWESKVEIRREEAASTTARPEQERAKESTTCQPEVPESSAQASLSSAFAAVAAPRGEGIDKDKTVGFYSTLQSNEPVVGYLICTKGEDYGCGFPLKSGNNTIGRSQSMDVVIMDPKVSREKQAFVMYEPHKRQFYVKPGEGSGLCYFNEDVVLAPMEIHQFDRIGVGDTELMLIPVCCEQFCWEE